MRIVFDLHNTGLGNNGGSRTLIKCGEVLTGLGHNVTLFTEQRSKYTWHPPCVNISHTCPECDIVVATGAYSVPHALQVKAKARFYYIRGFELWRHTEEKLLKGFRQFNCIVNSKWLKKHLAKKGIKVELVYPGVDTDLYFPKPFVERKKLVGAIFSKKHKTKRHQDAIEVAKRAGYELELLNKNIVNGTPQEVNNWYNTIRVWFAPPELEGLHNPPMEASLAGCSLVCCDHPRSGMQDYAIHEKTALVYPARDLDKAAEQVKELMENDELRKKLWNKMEKRLFDYIGDRRHNMQRLVAIFKRAL